LAKSKPRARDLKKQRWAGIVAAILAFGMLVSLVGVYIGQTLRRDQVVPPGQQEELQPDDYLAYYQQQVDNLELYLEDNEPTENVLLELAENYHYLVYIRQMFFDDQDKLQETEDKLANVYRSLVDLEPDKAQYRLELINFYLSLDQDDPAVEQINVLLGQLHENPDPLYHLSLVGLLNSVGEIKPALGELATDEIEWLKAYFEGLIDAGPLDSQDQFYYAVLLGEYLDDREAAEELLTQILEQEDEESEVYQDALGYRSYLRPAEEIEGEIPDTVQPEEE
jgi:hypothetical protein